MIDFLDKRYSSIIDNNKFLARIGYYSFQRLALRLIANVLIPLYYLVTKNVSNACQTEEKESKKKLIVSLTTIPLRINKVWIVIESILRQTHKPDMIILWLSKDQFESVDSLPGMLLQQQKRGLTIRFCDGDIRSHKKYFYALIEFPDDILITIDDDIIYNTNMISQLIELNKAYPDSICCHRARYIKIQDTELMPYSTWEEAKNFIADSDRIFFTTGGGTLFPPKCFTSEVLKKEVFMRYCPNADDIWLNIHCRLKKTKIIKSGYFSYLLPVLYYNNIELAKQNLGCGQNDIQLKNTGKFYIENLGVDVFSNIINDN